MTASQKASFASSTLHLNIPGSTVLQKILRNIATLKIWVCCYTKTSFLYSPYYAEACNEFAVQMQTSVLFCAKTSDFSEFMVCPHGQGERGLKQCGHFADKGGRDQFFAILCGRLLWTAP